MLLAIHSLTVLIRLLLRKWAYCSSNVFQPHTSRSLRATYLYVTSYLYSFPYISSLRARVHTYINLVPSNSLFYYVSSNTRFVSANQFNTSIVQTNNPLYPWQYFSHSICNILTFWYSSYLAHSCSHIPPGGMVSNQWVLLVQWGFHIESISYHTVVITKNMVGSLSSCIGIPSILNLNLKCSTSSIHCFNAINSDENALVSTFYCLLLNHFTGAELTNRMCPEWDLLVTLLALWDESTKAAVRNATPLGLGILWGIYSFAPR